MVACAVFLRRLSLLLLLPLAGCSWFSAATSLRVLLPEPPELWRRSFPEIQFELVIPVPGAGVSLTLDPPGDIQIPKNSNWPVLAYPRVLESRVRLPPAGAVYPLDLIADEPSGPSLALSWEHGPLAEILQALIRERIDVSGLNTHRLAGDMSYHSGADPWRLDLEHLATRLASGSFRATDIRALPCRVVVLELDPGEWFLESPFTAPIEFPEGGSLHLPEIPVGFHRLFAVGMSRWYDVFVGLEEVWVMVHE